MERSLTVSPLYLLRDKRMLTDPQRIKRANPSDSLSEMAQSSKVGTLALQVCKQAVSVASSSQPISHTARREWQGCQAILS